MADRYRAAVIGLGKIGWRAEADPVRPKPASHVGAWRNLPRRVELVGVCDANVERLGSLARTWLFTEAQDMLKRTQPDIVPSCLAQGDISRENLDNVDPGADLCQNCVGNPFGH